MNNISGDSILTFCCRGEFYFVNAEGNIKGPNSDDFVVGWKLEGISEHPWKTGPEILFSDIMMNPDLMVDSCVWDSFMGEMRIWGGECAEGKLARVSEAYIQNGY